MASCAPDFLRWPALLLWGEEKIPRLDRFAPARDWPIRFLSQLVRRLPAEPARGQEAQDSEPDRNPHMASGPRHREGWRQKFASWCKGRRLEVAALARSGAFY